MTPAQFWSIALVVIVVFIVFALVQRYRQTARGGTSVLAGGLRAVRSIVTRRGAVGIDVLHLDLVDQAIRAARRIPGGRHIPSEFHLRCGTDFYTELHPYAAEFEDSFRVELARTADGYGYRHEPPAVVVELDESLPPGSYAFDVGFPGLAQPPQRGKVTDFFQRGPAGGAGAQHPTALWTVVPPDNRPRSIRADKPFTIGADSACDLVLTDQYVSGVHVTLTARGTELLVQDGNGNGKRSRNHTVVNGHEIASMTLRPQADPAVLRLGPNITLRLRYVT
jgi:hypothetical protein